jgi:hypothetical protein
MSSFFTLPASQRKRKRDDRAPARASKKRGVVVTDETEGRKGFRKQEGRDESISISGSGSDGEEDIIESVGEGSSGESSSLSDEGETAADRRRKLAERYLENIREEVDEAGFDAAEIDRDLIAERLKEDVVSGLFIPVPYAEFDAEPGSGRVERPALSPDRFTIEFHKCFTCLFPGKYPIYDLSCHSLAVCLYGIERQSFHQMGIGRA